jgi:MFS family permease
MTTAHHTGFLLGPALGGLVIDYLSWRWTFFFLVPIGLVGASLALANPRTRSVAARGRSVDYLGATLVFATTTALVLFLDRRTLDLLGAQTKGALAIAFLGSLSALVMHESRAPNPFFNFALFKIRLFSLSALSLLIVAIGYTLPAFVLPFYLQDILHLSPSFIGILFMAPAIVTIMLAPLSGWMTDRLGPRLPASLGVIFLIVSLLLGMFFKTDSHWLLPGSMIALGAITNGIFNPANSAAMITLMPRGERGFASAVNHVTFGLGNVLGVALGGLFMTAAFEYHTGLSGVSPTTSNAPGFVEALNTTLMLTAGIVFIGLVTSAIRGGRAAPAASL